jgi:hypothetical protein
LETQKDHAPETRDITKDLLLSIQEATISRVHSATTDAESEKLNILKKGRHIPQCGVFDLKTRSVKRIEVDTLSEELPRLWVRQIPNFVLAYHTFGKFKDIRVQDVRENLKHWEESQQPALVKFATFARSTESGKIEIERAEGENALNLREPGGVVNSVLPSVITSKWDVENST